MRLPKLNQLSRTKEITRLFGGLNRNIDSDEGEWFNQKNMTTDYFPAASPRGKRSVQQIIKAHSIPVEDGSADALPSARGVCCLDNSVFTLRPISKNDSVQGYWLFDGETPICNTEINNGEGVAFLEKAACFNKNSSSFRSCFNMGSYICSFPDGVIFESANNDNAFPLYKIEQEKSFGSDEIEFKTVIEEGNKNYKPVSLSANTYRYNDCVIQKYLEDEALWVNQETFVMIFKKNTTGTFDDFNEGDTVCIDYSSIKNTDPYASIYYKGGIFDKKTKKANVKIIQKGKTGDSSLGIEGLTDYIIVSGFICAIHGRAPEPPYGSYQISETMTGVSVRRKKPEIAFACESQNRIWACSADGHEIYASALGDPYNFYDFSGLSTDSYAVNVGTHGAFTGCVNYLGKPIFFKENALYIINGSYPSNGGEIDGMSYSVSTLTPFCGVEKGSEKSLVVIDNILYYKSASGIVAFDGTNTVVVSDALGKTKYKNAVAGALGGKYYVSMQDEEGTYRLFVYDTGQGTWCEEDETHILQFVNAGSKLLYINADDERIYSVSDENVLNLDDYEKEGDFKWFCETGNLGYSYPNCKYLSRFQIRLQIADGARASFFIQYDSDGVWHRKGEMTGKGIKTHLVPIIPIRCDHMKIRIEGRGDVKLLSISKILEEGGDVQ
ncbi:MAG: hypothetical protein IJ731_01695 [Eubacterium sp.]|nr:hypothetical protein [Eubacterium sp.]